MDAAVHAERRQRFLGQLPAGSLVVLRAAPETIRSNDVEYPYRADNDLLYLTGFPEPEAVCLLDSSGPVRFRLFVRARDPEREAWTGPRLGAEGARERFSAEEAYTLDRFDEVFRKLLDEREYLYYPFGRDEAFNQRVIDHARRSQATRARSGAPDLHLMAALDPLHEMRLRKSPDEIARMRTAAEITAAAHREAHAAARPGAREHEIEAAITFAFRRHGAAGPAYPPIVASGRNATILHYTENSRRIDGGDLVLIDAGAEYEHYCADVTRTFPVGPSFTPEQRAIYDLVLAAQEAAIERVAAGVAVDDVHATAVGILVDGLRSLGVLAASRDEAIEKEAYKPFYMHRTSHWLGMDVHDVGRYRDGAGPRRLEPGMVLTVEPGLYFGPGTVESRFQGIGVRIEDDVLVIDGGREVLTAAIPKEPGEVESRRVGPLVSN